MYFKHTLGSLASGCFGEYDKPPDGVALLLSWTRFQTPRVLQWNCEASQSGLAAILGRR